MADGSAAPSRRRASGGGVRTPGAAGGPLLSHHGARSRGRAQPGRLERGGPWTPRVLCRGRERLSDRGDGRASPAARVPGRRCRPRTLDPARQPPDRRLHGLEPVLQPALRADLPASGGPYRSGAGARALSDRCRDPGAGGLARAGARIGAGARAFRAPQRPARADDRARAGDRRRTRSTAARGGEQRLGGERAPNRGRRGLARQRPSSGRLHAGDLVHVGADCTGAACRRGESARRPAGDDRPQSGSRLGLHQHHRRYAGSLRRASNARRHARRARKRAIRADRDPDRAHRGQGCRSGRSGHPLDRQRRHRQRRPGSDHQDAHGSAEPGHAPPAGPARDQRSPRSRLCRASASQPGRDARAGLRGHPGSSGMSS